MVAARPRLHQDTGGLHHLFLERGAKLELKDNRERTALTSATESKNESSIELLKNK